MKTANVNFNFKTSIKVSLMMANNEEAPGKGETSTEAYEEKMEAMSGACAADYWAGPGINKPALDGNGVSVSKCKPKKSSKSSKRELEKRVVKLERVLQEKEREARKKKTSKPKKVVERQVQAVRVAVRDPQTRRRRRRKRRQSTTGSTS